MIDGVIARYSLPEMAAVFSDEARLARWLEIELLATEAWAASGVVPAGDAAACRAGAPTVDADFVAAWAEREQVTDHDVAAFVDEVQSAIARSGAPDAPTSAKWIHYGLTSSDVVDTAGCWMLRDAADLLLEASNTFVATLKAAALRHRDTAMIGRTHGVHAEPTTFGAKLALWCLQADRDRARLRSARAAIAVGKLSGAVGTYANVEPEVERRVCEALGSGAGARHAGDRPRPSRRVPVGDGGRRGHRRADRRRAAAPAAHRGTGGGGGLQAGPEGVLGHAAQAQSDHRRAAVWLGEDPAGQSHGRVGGCGALARAGHLPLIGRAGDPAGLVPARVLRAATGRLAPGRPAGLPGADAAEPLVQPRPRLLPTGAAGAGRRPGWPATTAYRIVQDDAMRAWEDGVSFRSLLEKDERVDVGAGALDEAFSLERALATPAARLRRTGRGTTCPELRRCRSSTGARCATSTTPGRDRLLMVASDRLSAFDVVMAGPGTRQGSDPHGDERVLVRAAATRRGAEPLDLDRADSLTGRRAGPGWPDG